MAANKVASNEQHWIRSNTWYKVGAIDEASDDGGGGGGGSGGANGGGGGGSGVDDSSW